MGAGRFELPTLKYRDLEHFRRFLRVDLQLSESTVNRYVYDVKRFLRYLGKSRVVDKEIIRSYLERFTKQSTYSYSNVLKPIKIYFRDYMRMGDLVSTFKFPRKVFVPKFVPSKEELRRFYKALDNLRDKALFLMYATTGLRRSEILELKIKDVDLDKRMVIPKNHARSQTKHAYCSFYNDETSKVLNEYLKSRNDNSPKLFPMRKQTYNWMWRKARNKTGINITPKILRQWFCCEMAELGVPDRYVDAFCGRTPKSVLARHYTDYRPLRIKRIYERANLRVLS